uniref:Uncharacterized protein n=1 Tax=Anguilla anguilla TaxID=7936 RepID=A0A0E9QSC3_ANGAN
MCKTYDVTPVTESRSSNT